MKLIQPQESVHQEGCLYMAAFRSLSLGNGSEMTCGMTIVLSQLGE